MACEQLALAIDTLQKVRISDGNGGMYANDYKEAGVLKKLADKYGICILLINRLRNERLSIGQYTDAADDMLLKLY